MTGLYADLYLARQAFYREAYYRRGAPPSMRSGWSNADAQRRAYSRLCKLFDRDGAVLDLGCGDGRLLAYLLRESGRALAPFGVDFLAESIELARVEVLPEHAASFAVENVDEFDPGALRFAYVITAPCYVVPTRQPAYLQRCLGWLQPGGRLVLHEYRGSPGYDTLERDVAAAGLAIASCERDELLAVACCMK